MPRTISMFAIGITCLTLTLACRSEDQDLQRVDRVERNTRVIGTLKNGKKHGRWTKLLDGKLFRIEHYRDGKKHGPRYSWLDDTGEMTSDSMYANGYLHGRFRIFYRPGQLAELGWLSRGNRERTWCSWREDGSLEYIRTYQQDKIIREDIDPPGQCPVIFGDGARHTDPKDQDFR